MDDLSRAVIGFPQQLKEAYQAARRLRLPDWPEPSRIVVTGLGGSAVSGDFLRAWLEPWFDVPIVVNRGYTLPGFVDESTLVIASSYSGETEETIEAAELAFEARAKVLAVTTGGRLADLVEASGGRVWRVPTGFQPRAALGWLFAFPAVALARLGGLEDEEEWDETFEALEAMTAWAEPWLAAGGPATDDHPAGHLSRLALGRRLVLYGGEAVGQVVAYRWQSQLNENAKLLVHHHHLPEMNHNEIVGWEGGWVVPDPSGDQDHRPGAVAGDGGDGPETLAVFLRHRREHRRTSLRFEITRQLIESSGRARVVQVEAAGSLALAQVLTLAYLGDVWSVGLALRLGRDPGAIRPIQILKEQLAARRQG